MEDLYTDLLRKAMPEEFAEADALEKKQKNCKHNCNSYTQCTDFHRSLWGTFCCKCDKEIS